MRVSGGDPLAPMTKSTNAPRKPEFIECRRSRCHALLHASDFVIPSPLDIRHSSFRQRHIRHASRTSRALQRRLHAPRSTAAPLARRDARALDRSGRPISRISETPIFLTREFRERGRRRREQISRRKRARRNSRSHAATAIPAGLEVAERTVASRASWWWISAESARRATRLVPRLIVAARRFPSLLRNSACSSSAACAKLIRRSRADWTSSFGGIDDDDYLKLLRRTMSASSRPGKCGFARDRPANRRHG